ncbi:MAG: hypothetical protein ACOY5B_11580 [Spirochaetota bacterium]
MKNRKSIRLKGYDYSRPGHNFVTICTHQRTHLLWAVRCAPDLRYNFAFGKITQVRLVFPQENSEPGVSVFRAAKNVSNPRRDKAPETPPRIMIDP